MPASTLGLIFHSTGANR